MKSTESACNVATLIERYFTERLMRQRNVSANTIASYRDTFRLLTAPVYSDVEIETAIIALKRLRGFEVDHQIEARRPLHGRLGRLFTFENAIEVNRRRCA